MVKNVIKRDGTKEAFHSAKIFTALVKAGKEIVPLTKAERIAHIVLPLVVNRIEAYRHSEISIEIIQDIVEESLMKAEYVQIAKAYILYRKYRQDVRCAKNKLGIKDELKLSLNAACVLKERYLLKDEHRRVIETPRAMFQRVADCVARAERSFSRGKEVFYRDAFYEKMISLEFLPNSPALMNAGTSLGQLSACFVLPVDDSMPGIFSALTAMALIHQSGGGTGFSFSRLRPKDDIVSSTKGTASGPVSFMEVFDAATKVIVQGGKRRGANMAVLRVDHPDIVEFIEAKSKKGVLENFNLSVGITDVFMRALKHNGSIGLINPRTKKVVRKIEAKTLFSSIAFNAYMRADPGLIFLDHINKTHPLKRLGEIETTNPCGEIPLLPYESCVLGSVNVSKFVNDKKIDWLRLAETVKTGVRFLDNVIEITKYPLPKIEMISKASRKIGLGVMGFADMLIKLRIPYNSPAAVTCAQKLMKFIRRISVEASVRLAGERGVFPYWEYSLYRKHNLKLRNATLNSIAPTGSLSIIAGCSSGIEPLFALSFMRNVLEGKCLYEMNSLIERVAKEEGVYSKKLMECIQGEATLKNIKGIPSALKNNFVTTFDIMPVDHLKIQAAFQALTDNAVSKTINIPYEATFEDVKDIYLKAHALKLKGITVYRYGSKEEQVLYKEKNLIDVDESCNEGCFGEKCMV